MTPGLTIQIDDEGTMRFIYDDRLADLLTPGASAVERASHVEPHPLGGWYADMRPSDGPVLGERLPFATRAAALAAEVEWLQAHRGL